MTTTTEPTTVVALTNRQIHVLLAGLNDRIDRLATFTEGAAPTATFTDSVEALAAEAEAIGDLLRQANARLPRDSERTR